MEKNPNKGPSTGNINNNKSLPLKRNAPPPDPDNSDGSNNNNNVINPPYRLPRRPIKRFNVSLKGGKKDDNYVNNRCACIIAVFLTNISINPI